MATKIILKHNSSGSSLLPVANNQLCCEPLFYMNKLFIRSQLAGDLTTSDQEKEELLASGYLEGNPIFIGPYEHPLRITGSQLAVNVSENTQSTTEDYIYTSPSANSGGSRWFRALTGIVTDKNGHIITAEGGFSIQGNATVKTIPRFRDNNYQAVLSWLKTEGHGSIVNQLPIGFSMNGSGYINENGSLEAVDNGPGGMDENYTWSIGTGDCIAVTDADWSSHSDMGQTVDDQASYTHMLVRSKLSFDTSKHNEFLCRDGSWATPSGGVNVSASTGDTTVKGVVAGSVSIDNVVTEFTVQPANSNMSMNSGYYYTGQGVVRPLGTTTGVLDSKDGEKVFYNSDSSSLLDQIGGRLLCNPNTKNEWCAIPVYVDYHTIPDTGRVEAVPYILLPFQLLETVLSNWASARTYPGSETEGNIIKGQPAYHSSNQQNNE